MSDKNRLFWIEVFLVVGGLLLLSLAPIGIVHWLSVKKDSSVAAVAQARWAGTKVECDEEWEYSAYGKLVNFRHEKLAFVPGKLTRPASWIFAKLGTPRGDVQTVALRTISNHRSDLSPRGLQLLRALWKEKSSCARLTVLNFNGCNIDTDTLVGIESLPVLEVLEVSGSRVDDRLLARLGSAPALRALALANTSVSGKNLGSVAGSRLVRLDLSGCKSLKGPVFSGIAAQTDLEDLVLDDAALPAVDGQALAGMAKLARLSLVRCPLDDGGATALASSESLVYLDLTGTKVGEAGVLALAKKSKVSHLKLNGLRIGESALLALAANPALHWLDLRGCGISPELAGRLRQANPRLVVFVDNP